VFDECAMPSEELHTDMFVKSRHVPGGVAVAVGRCESLEVGDVLKHVCVCVCQGVAFSVTAGTDSVQ
jgi:hypothetical protein